MNNENKVIRVLELFAGVGGFRVGLENANKKLSNSAYKVVWSNQWDPDVLRQYASEIYLKRWGNKGHTCKDIAQVKTKDIPAAEMLVAGFPCQDYSVAKGFKGEGLHGKKGVLWWQLVKIIEDMKPDFLLLENVDRLLGSPAKRKGKDFAIMLAKLNDLKYAVEWRVINAADYGFPQKRKRVFIFAYREVHPLYMKASVNPSDWILNKSVVARAFPHELATKNRTEIAAFHLKGTLEDISNNFGTASKKKAFLNTGIAINRQVLQYQTIPVYAGKFKVLGDVLEKGHVDASYYIANEDLPKWVEVKAAKRLKRTSKDGYEYEYAEGAISYPDSLLKPARTIITGEGGKAPNRSRHVIKVGDSLRRLTPIELERLNGFDDNHTLIEDISPSRRAYLMGNALVTGVIERIAITLMDEVNSTITEARLVA